MKEEITKEQLTISTIFLTIIFLVIIFLICYTMIQTQIKVQEYCNDKYGLDNWEFNETTGNKFYLGQTWECVPILNKSILKEK